MKLWAVAMVRNEADIVEAFVRHNLAFLDGLAVLDHRSTDRTFEILGALQAEGLPVVRLRTLEPALYKGSHLSALARECFARAGPDFVFVLDADEFVVARSRAGVEEALGEVPRGSHAQHAWRSYVPTSFHDGFGAHCLRLRVREEAVPRAKVIIGRHFRDAVHEMVSEGNHGIVDTRTQARAAHHRIAAERLCLAHCPVRNAAQLAFKVRLGYEARLAGGNGRLEAGMSYHWRDLCDDLARGVELTAQRLRLIAMNYALPREKWVAEDEVELVENPLELRGVRGSRSTK